LNKVGVIIIPVPDSLVQRPVFPSSAGLFPDSVTKVSQTVLSAPAVIGGVLFVTTTKSGAEQIPFDTVHSKVIFPLRKPVTVAL